MTHKIFKFSFRKVGIRILCVDGFQAVVKLVTRRLLLATIDFGYFQAAEWYPVGGGLVFDLKSLNPYNSAISSPIGHFHTIFGIVRTYLGTFQSGFFNMGVMWLGVKGPHECFFL